MRSAASSNRLRLPRLLLANVLFGSGLFAHAFLYNFYLEALGRGPAQMGLAFSALTAGGLMALVPAGMLVDRQGPRAAFAWAALVAGLGLGWGAAAVDPAEVYASAFLAGMGTSAWRVATGPLLLALTDGAARARAFSWNVGLLVGSGAVWTLGAGYLAGAAGEGLTGVRVALAVGAGLTLLSALLVPVAPPVPRTERQGGLAHLAIPARLAAAVGAVALWMAASGMVLPFFNLWLKRDYLLPVERVGVVMAGAQLVAGAALFLGGEIAARRGALRMLPPWIAVFPLVMLAMATAPALSAAIALFAVQGIVPPASNALIDQLLLEGAPEDRRGVVASWRGAATEGSGFAAAWLGGVVVERAGFSPLFLLAAAVASIAGAALLLLLRAPARGAEASDGSALARAGT